MVSVEMSEITAKKLNKMVEDRQFELLNAKIDRKVTVDEIIMDLIRGW